MIKKTSSQKTALQKVFSRASLLSVAGLIFGLGCTKDPLQDSVMGSHLKSAKLSLTTPQQQQALRICAAGETVRGIDVSKWAGEINWQQVAQEDIDFAFIRVSDGLHFVDAQFDRNWAQARANGIRRGVYQFFRAHLDPIEQANLLLEKMGSLQPGDLPPVIDIETDNGQSAEQIAANVRLWVDHVEAATGVQPIIYTGVYFWNDNVDSDAFADYLLWVPNYGVTCPLVPNAWNNWAFWQDTDTGSINGIDGNTDLNYFNGNLDALAALSFSQSDVPPIDDTTDAGFSETQDAGSFTTDAGDRIDSGAESSLDAGLYFSEDAGDSLPDANSFSAEDAGDSLPDANSFSAEDAGDSLPDTEIDNAEPDDDESELPPPQALPPSVVNRCACAQSPSQRTPFAFWVIGFIGFITLARNRAG